MEYAFVRILAHASGSVRLRSLLTFPLGMRPTLTRSVSEVSLAKEKKCRKKSNSPVVTLFSPIGFFLPTFASNSCLVLIFMGHLRNQKNDARHPMFRMRHSIIRHCEPK